MQDTELYQRILGLESPWKVERVLLDVKGGSVDIFVEHHEETLPCPTCQKACAIYDHTPARSWRHLDSCQFKTVLHARTPRVDCGEHGIHQVTLPWAEPRSRFTAMFERFAIDVLRETSVLGATKILRISWDEAFGIMGRAVERGLARRVAVPVEYVGIDEKAIRKGHRYLTIATDLRRSAVLWLGEDRKTATLDGFWQSWTPERRAQVKAVAMDMWEPYFQSTAAHLPEGATKIVHDRFHIMQHANDAVDKVRRSEHFALMRENDRTLEKSRWMWLYAQENVPEKYAERFAELRRITTRTGKAWMLKEDLRYLWAQDTVGAGKAFLKRWMRWAKRTTLQPIAKLAAMIKLPYRNMSAHVPSQSSNAHASWSASSSGLKSRASFSWKTRSRCRHQVCVSRVPCASFRVFGRASSPSPSSHGQRQYAGSIQRKHRGGSPRHASRIAVAAIVRTSTAVARSPTTS